MSEAAARQQTLRARLFAAHRPTLDTYWSDEGYFAWPPHPEASGGYRAILWHCLSYLTGDAHCVAKANRIVVANYTPHPCHFAPGAAIDLLYHHRPRLTPAAQATLERYLRLNVPFMATEDLKIHGYNDNHVYKAIHALVVGGELLGLPSLVELGLAKLRQAIELLARNGFPCEYNSPNYTPVSLNPLANLVEQAANPEARELALRLERFYWQDLALHWDARCGLPAGPFSRGGANDYSGLFSGDLNLLAYLFPDRFDFDLLAEVYGQGLASKYLAANPETATHLPFFQAHPVWYASATYHYTPELEALLFAKPAGTGVQGTAEVGVSAVTWHDGNAPRQAPRRHMLGPHRSLLTTWYGRDFSLGTSQYSWLDNGQGHGFLATVKTGPKVRPEDAATYYARLFFNEEYPYGEVPPAKSSYLKDNGDIHTVQHEGSALVLYNPLPRYGSFKRLRTGVFRPLDFSQPRELWIGETPVPTLNLICDRLAPIAIDEGQVYVGLIPLRLTDRGQAREAHLQVQSYSHHLAILMSSFEGWSAREFDYEEILDTNAGFVCELQPADAFASFAEFRRWLAQASVTDHYYADMRTTSYRRPGLALASCYSPYTSAFRHASINGQPVALDPPLRLTGLPDPGCGLAPSR